LNFKYLLILILIAGCGVKGDPTSPKTPAVPSLLEQYPDISPDKPLNDIKPAVKNKKRR
jgi:hypothetical protein